MLKPADYPWANNHGLVSGEPTHQRLYRRHKLQANAAAEDLNTRRMLTRKLRLINYDVLNKLGNQLTTVKHCNRQCVHFIARSGCDWHGCHAHGGARGQTTLHPLEPVRCSSGLRSPRTWPLKQPYLDL